MLLMDTKITAVTVYPDRARVTRAGRIEIESGAQSVTISPLPRNLDESSVRATGSASQTGARLTGVQITHQMDTRAQAGPAQDAQDKLQSLRDQDKILADEEDAWTQRLNIIKSIGTDGGENFSRSVARGRLVLDDLTGVLDYLSQSHEAAANTLREIALRRRELQKQIKVAEQEAEKLGNAAALETLQAQVDLEVSARGAVEIELTYTVYNASWTALYDARLEGARLEWNYLARVQQNTGEDWNTPFALTLSTATLATGLDKPELTPWRVDMYRPPQPRMMRAAAGGPMMVAAPAPMAEMAMPADAMPMQKMAYEQATVETGNASVTYTIATPRPIPSDGEPHQVAIATLELDAQIDYFCAPKVDEHAFIRAEFTNPSDYLMLGGEANLYHGADFVGTRQVETIVPQQKVEFFLGAEERIRVKRKETKRVVDKSLLGNTGRTTLAYRITVENPSLDSARVTVLDQIPVSAHPDIRVKPGRIAPETTPNDQGELEWQRELKRGETADLEFEVTVEYPKEMRVVGL